MSENEKKFSSPPRGSLISIGKEMLFNYELSVLVPSTGFSYLNN